VNASLLVCNVATTLVLGLAVVLPLHAQTTWSVLVFSRTAGFRHDSIADGVGAIAQLGREHGFSVDATEDAAWFNDQALSGYRAVVFLLTTGDVLSDDQQAAFERYIQAGGGYVGVHSATDTEYEWPWYGGLVGAYFADHPAIQAANVVLEDGSVWPRLDEWYNFRAPPRDVRVLAWLDESSYAGGTMGDHPIAWQHAYDGGRAWYTAGGHTSESYRDPAFVAHLLSGILYAAGLEDTTTASRICSEIQLGDARTGIGGAIMCNARAPTHTFRRPGSPAKIKAACG
jgi:cytochrome c